MKGLTALLGVSPMAREKTPCHKKDNLIERDYDVSLKPFPTLIDAWRYVSSTRKSIVHKLYIFKGYYRGFDKGRIGGITEEILTK